MITKIQIQGYKALRDVSLDLTPIHVLIGPNDSGKSSILEAVGALCRSVDLPLERAFQGRWEGRDLVWKDSSDGIVSFSATVLPDNQEEEGSRHYHLLCVFNTTGKKVHVVEENEGDSDIVFNRQRACTGLFDIRGTNSYKSDLYPICNALSGSHQYRWIPQHLSLPAAIGSVPAYEMTPTGFGLVLCFDELLGNERDRFDHLVDQFRDIFPEIKDIKIKQTQKAYEAEPQSSLPQKSKKVAGKELFIAFKSGFELPASQVSDGILLVLAYLTLLHIPNPPRVLLIEEPENGVHPKLLSQVINMLRELILGQSRTQVILTTHSPYLLDLFEPDEVTMCRKNPDGAVTVHRLSDSKTVQEQINHFTVGEIWSNEEEKNIAGSIEHERGHESI